MIDAMRLISVFSPGGVNMPPGFEMMLALSNAQATLHTHSQKLYDMCSARPGDWRRHMLLAVRPHIDARKQKEIDLLLAVLALMEQ